MKKVLLLSIILTFVIGVHAQKLNTINFSTADGNLPEVGKVFNVPINVESIGEVWSIEIYFQYDTTVLTYIDTANSAYDYLTPSVAGPGIILLDVGQLADLSTIADGKLVDLKFKYLAGDSELKFGTEDDPVGGFTSVLYKSDFTDQYFQSSDVTNGSIDGDIVENLTIASNGDWNDTLTWKLNVVPNKWHNVIIHRGDTVMVSAGITANTNNVTVRPEGALTVEGTLNTNQLQVRSDENFDGSFIYGKGTVNATKDPIVIRYVSTKKWVGISAPLEGQLFDVTYLNGDPQVWVKKWNEPAGQYEWLTDPSEPMGDMVGYFAWMDDPSIPEFSTEYKYKGALRLGSVTNNNLTRTSTSDGFNFVGNPYTSAIDWDAASGWTKNNVDNAIYVFNNGTWQTYVGGVGTNGGSNYIALGQGFFVRVTDNGGNNTGSLTVNQDACVHNGVDFVKSTNSDQRIVRLNLESNGLNDETVIRFSDEATTDFDGDLDAVKAFSFDENYPQIYTVSGQKMSINSLPYSDGFSIPMNVHGKEGDLMTISLTENGIDKIYLKDNLTGDVVDLTASSYTFENVNLSDNRFELLYGVTGVDEPVVSNDVRVFAYNKSIRVELGDLNQVSISVYNLLGQVVKTLKTGSKEINIAVQEKGFYLVKVDDGVNVTTKKVLIN